MLKNAFLIGILLYLTGCMTLPQYAQIYFTQSDNNPAYENAATFLERMRKTKSLRLALAEDKDKAQLLARCSLLRNQFFAAALRGGVGSDGKMVKEAAAALEKAYQSSDEELLQVCQVQRQTTAGEEFWRVQQLYARIL